MAAGDFKEFDAGPWEVGEAAGGRLFVQSNDFKYDVRLYISGDFPRNVDVQYADALARFLNEECS